MVRWKEFKTPFTDGKFVKLLLADVKKSKEAKKKGKPFKSAKEMVEEYNITMDQLKDTIKSQTDAEGYEVSGFTLSGNTRIRSNGSVARAFSRAGVLMVEAIEEAYVQMKFNVPITGCYLVGKNWSECH